MLSKKIPRDVNEPRDHSVVISKTRHHSETGDELIITYSYKVSIRERLGLRHRRTHLLEPMHVGCASLSCWQSRSLVGAHGIMFCWFSHSRAMPSRLQQRTSRWTRLRVRWKCLQLHLSNETDHVWAGSRKYNNMIDDLSQPSSDIDVNRGIQ